jgi:hypothetical protein
MNLKNSGYLVETKEGKMGRTFHNKGLVNGKVPVYLCVESRKSEVLGYDLCIKYSDSAILCDPATLKTRGFID